MTKLLVELRRLTNPETSLILGIIVLEDLFLALYLAALAPVLGTADGFGEAPLGGLAGGEMFEQMGLAAGDEVVPGEFGQLPGEDAVEGGRHVPVGGGQASVGRGGGEQEAVLGGAEFDGAAEEIVPRIAPGRQRAAQAHRHRVEGVAKVGAAHVHDDRQGEVGHERPDRLVATPVVVHKTQAVSRFLHRVAEALAEDAGVALQALEPGAQGAAGEPGVAHRAQVGGMPAARRVQGEGRVGQPRAGALEDDVGDAARKAFAGLRQLLGRNAQPGQQLGRIEPLARRRGEAGDEVGFGEFVAHGR